MGSPDRYIAVRKTIPQGDCGSRMHVNGTEPSTVVQTETYNVGQTEASRLLPWNHIEVALPFVPVTKIHDRGGRVIGGGTSKDALRRAKRDLRAQRV